ncbi:tyrosine-type recombinase/integrase [Aneurinibacillus tyrosinisolvens]|uniref:tyrosine-type recombinase/integrase n=1 Tax=Aneurinibacillus tyrosinisolvens TaxID=1443435 RepID=UPI000699D652|nr:tyrosine-type recombinase/integrase [Aneurinibacillus tyrosinisolvens]
MNRPMEVELTEFLLYLEVEKNLTPRTIREYQMDLKLLIQVLQERKCVQWNQVTYRDLRHFLHHLQHVRHNSATARARKVSSVKGFFSFLYEEGLIDSNPSIRLRKPKLEKRLPVYLSEDDCRRFIQVIQEHSHQRQRDLPIILLFLYTGIRLSELTGLDVQHVDLHSQTIRVYGKGRKERVIPILSPLLRHLTAYLEYREQLLGEDFFTFRPLFFTRRDQNWHRIHRRTVHEIFIKYSKLACIDQKHFSAHKLRHTFATLLYSQGVNLIELKQLLGHTSVSTTEIYTHTSSQQLKNALTRHPLHFDKEE